MRKITEHLIKSFEEYLISEEKADATLEKYIRDVLAFMHWVCGREIDKELVLLYKQMILKNYSVSSVNSMLSSLNCFFYITIGMIAR